MRTIGILLRAVGDAATLELYNIYTTLFSWFAIQSLNAA
jgi:hypothetical protein